MKCVFFLGKGLIVEGLFMTLFSSFFFHELSLAVFVVFQIFLRLKFRFISPVVFHFRFVSFILVFGYFFERSVVQKKSYRMFITCFFQICSSNLGRVEYDELIVTCFWCGCVVVVVLKRGGEGGGGRGGVVNVNGGGGGGGGGVGGVRAAVFGPTAVLRAVYTLGGVLRWRLVGSFAAAPRLVSRQRWFKFFSVCDEERSRTETVESTSWDCMPFLAISGNSSGNHL